MEPIDLYVEMDSDCNAVGSTTWECMGHHVVFSIYGPDEAKVTEELTHRACVTMTVTPPSGQHTLRESELELFLISVLERLIDVKEFPRTKVIPFVVVLAEHIWICMYAVASFKQRSQVSFYATKWSVLIVLNRVVNMAECLLILAF
ncbi:unnamed protein product [Echinostoma caproni]|uniref:RNase_PH domain-containing protein n=1 Tax=Echinostoma caproni TaxID=27848 RepID=A0A183B7V2_9TREM|nr:unnamed protein product [Echinostoma caproni]